MFDVGWFKGKKITVMGLGVHGGGVGVAKWLRRHGAIVTATDLRDQHSLASSIDELERTFLQDVRRLGKREIQRIRYVLGSHPEELFTDADMVIRNPAVPRGHKLLALAHAKGVPVESDISLFFTLCPFPIAAVSGTKGKTTTTLLLAAMAKEADARTVIGGNVRISPLDRLDALLAVAKKRKPVPPPIVLELSSWQLESLEPRRLSPHVGVLTMIAEDHLDRYDGMDDYARAKEIIISHQKKDDVAVLNADDPRVSRMKSGKGRRFWFSQKPRRGLDGCFVVKGAIVLKEDGRTEVVAPLSALRMPGAHNRVNALAAVAAARAMGLPIDAIRRGLAGFTGVPHRLEVIRELRGVTYVNDTAATAPDASVAAIETFVAKKKSGRIVLLAGGADKNLPFDAWASVAAKHAKHLVMFDGSATPKMESALSTAGLSVPIAIVRSMREALGEAAKHAEKGDVVLLSPGCASFGIFRNEFDRGDQFVALVKKLR